MPSVYQTVPLTYDLNLARYVVEPDGKWVTAQMQFVRAETPVFAVSFCAGAIGSKAVVNLGTVTSWIFTIKALANYGGANLLRSTTAPVITGSGATTLYSFTLPNYNTTQLADAFVILDPALEALADDGQLPTLPANQTARYDLTGLKEGYVVRQVDTSTYWKVIDRHELDNSAGWSTEVEQRSYVDCALQIDFTIVGVTDKTRALPTRIGNDYAQTVAGATPLGSFPVLVGGDDVLTSPTAAELIAANPLLGGGGPAYATVRSTDGSTTDYPPASDTDAARGDALQLALASSVSGDAIIVGPGIADTFDLFKNGVNWYWFPGSGVTCTSNTDCGIFDDSSDGFNGPVSSIIGGYGDFNFTGHDAGGSSLPMLGVLSVTNAASVVRFDCNKISSNQNPLDTQTVDRAAILHSSGSLSYSAKMVTGLVKAVYYTDGQHDGESDLFSNSGPFASSVLHMFPTTGAQGTANITAHDIFASTDAGAATAAEGVRVEGSASALVKIGAYEVRGAIHGVICLGAKTYLTIQKGSVTTVDSDAWFAEAQGGRLWLNSQKVAGPMLYSSGSGSEIWAEIQDWEDNTTATSPCCEFLAGLIHFRLNGGPCVTMGGILQLGGTVFLAGRMDTSARSDTNPVAKEGGTLVLSAVLRAHASATSITAALAQNVIALGAWANTDPHANITIITPGGLSVNSNVQ